MTAPDPLPPALLSPQAPTPSATAPGQPQATPREAGPRRWSTAELLGPHREVLIDHQGAQYRLRVTALGKLILTK